MLYSLKGVTPMGATPFYLRKLSVQFPGLL